MAEFKPRDAHIAHLDSAHIPWDLLLDADPLRTRVETYLSQGFTRVAWYRDAPVGVYALERLSPVSFEIMNIAVHPDYQCSGLGRRLLGHAIGLAESKGGREVHLGTGNSSLRPLKIYQRMGFRIVGVIPDFFTENYPEPLEEDGIPCIDMLRLKLTLRPE